MQWLRLYDDLMDDPKVQRLPASLFKHWINILCLANKSAERGKLPPLEDIAFRLRIGMDEATAIIADLTDRGFIDQDPDGTRSPHNWTERQRSSDDVNARVARFRAGRATDSPASDSASEGRRRVTLHETLHARGPAEELKRYSNVTCNGADSESDTDSESEKTQRREEGERAPAPAAPPAPIEQPGHLMRAAADVLSLAPSSAIWRIWRPSAIRMLQTASEDEILHALSVKVAEKKGAVFKFEWLEADLPYLLTAIRDGRLTSAGSPRGSPVPTLADRSAKNEQRIAEIRKRREEEAKRV